MNFDLGAALLSEARMKAERQAPDPWEGQIYSIIDAYTPREPVKYVIDSLFREGSVNVVYGPPGSLKSLLLGDGAMHVSASLEWIGRHVIGGAALWIDLDNGKRRTHARVEALARAHNLPEDTPFLYVSMPSPWLNAGNKKDMAALEKRIIDRDITFVVIDNLSQICPGADENTDEMILIMAHIRLLAERTGAAIVIIHHQRKSMANARAGESLRGHSSIESAVDLALRVTREPDSNIITIESTKTRDMDVPLFACEFRYTHKPGTHELETAGFTLADIEDTTSDAAIGMKIIDVIREHPGINQTSLIIKMQGLVEVGEKQLRAIINQMESKKRIRAIPGAKRAKQYHCN
jgi:hypothetical protein